MKPKHLYCLCLSVTAIPQPYGLQLASRGLTWLKLHWGIIGDVVWDGYVVCYHWIQVNITNEMKSDCQVVPDNTYSFNVTGLKDCTVYSVNVTCTSTKFPTLVFKPSLVTTFQTAIKGNLLFSNSYYTCTFLCKC
jgi:hypothetical protein